MNKQAAHATAQVTLLQQNGAVLVIQRSGHPDTLAKPETNHIHGLMPGESITVKCVEAGDELQRLAASGEKAGQTLQDGLAQDRADNPPQDPPAASGPAATVVADDGVQSTTTTGRRASTAGSTKG